MKLRSKLWLIYLQVNFQQIKLDNVFTASSTVSKVRVSYLDVRNQVANFRWTLRAFKIKNTVFVICLKIGNDNEATKMEFSDLKARSKVRMKHFKVKMTGVCYVWVSKGYHGLVQVYKANDWLFLRINSRN